MKTIDNFEPQFGLNPLPKDKRDLKLGQLIQLPKLSELPHSYRAPALGIDDQFDSDFCAASASCKISEYQEGEPLSFEWQFAVAKALLGGDPDSFGIDLRTAMKSHVKVGALARKDAPYSLANQSVAFLRRIENWPENLKDLAIVHRKKAFASIVGPYDHYDNLRATIWYYRNEKKLPLIGTIWNWPMEQMMMDEPIETGFGHALYAAGWTTDGHLIIPNSYGPNAGDKGVHYFSRKVINRYVDIYGAYTFLDMEPAEVKKLVEQAQIGWMMRLITRLQEMVAELKKKI